MILIHIKQSLNADGKTYFPEWIKETRDNLSTVDGFIDLYQAKMDDSDLDHLIIRFEDKEKFIAWTQTDNHTATMGKLKKYHEKDPEMHILTLIA